MKRTSMIPLSPLRKRMDAVVDDVVDGLEQRTILERIKEYQDGIDIKERELKMLEDQNLAEMERLQRETSENQLKIKTVNDEILKDTIKQMEKYVSVEVDEQKSLDSKVHDLQNQKKALQRKSQDLRIDIDAKVSNAEAQLRTQEAMERDKGVKELELLQDELRALQSDVSHLNAEEEIHVTDITKIETEIENLIEEKEDLASTLIWNKEHLKELTQINTQLELELQDADLDNSTKSSELSKIKKEWSGFRDEYMNVKAQRIALEDHVSKWKHEHS